MAGFSNGTFEVQITDNYQADIKELQARYPYLASREVGKIVLLEWTHPELRGDGNTVIAVKTQE